MEFSPDGLMLLRALSQSADGLEADALRLRCGLGREAADAGIAALARDGLAALSDGRVRITENGVMELYLYNAN